MAQSQRVTGAPRYYWDEDSDNDSVGLASGAGPTANAEGSGGPRPANGDGAGEVLLDSDEEDQGAVLRKIKGKNKQGTPQAGDTGTSTTSGQGSSSGSSRKPKRKATSVEILALDESETVEELREQVESLKRSAKRRKVDDDATNWADIPREDIIELRELWTKESKYLQALNSNVFVHFAIAIATRCDHATASNGKQYTYVNGVYRGTIDTLFGADRDTSWAVAASTRALHAMGNAIRSFPGGSKDPIVKGMKDDFKEVYSDLATAIKRMRQRRAMMDMLDVLARPSERVKMADILDPGIVSILEELLSRLKLNSKAWAASGYTAESLVTSELQPFTVNAVAAMINHNRLGTKSLSRTTNDTRTAEAMVMMSIDVLLQNPPTRYRQRSVVPLGRFIETATGVQVAPYR